MIDRWARSDHRHRGQTDRSGVSHRRLAAYKNRRANVINVTKLADFALHTRPATNLGIATGILVRRPRAK